MKFANANNLDRKSGVRGPNTTGRSPQQTLSLWLAEETAPVHASSDEQSGESIRTIHFPPRYPGFPVEVGGVDKLHAAF
jgi:hypothetical protein